MRYIKKVDAPQFFIDDTHGLTLWSAYSNPKKLLREFILKNEQNYLCVYCESKISADRSSSHVEHIKPKSQDKYPELTFDYSNLAVSCNGNCYGIEEDNSSHNCGHIKDNEYDSIKFLSPTRTLDIRDYFKYDFDEGEIEPSSKNRVKAKYMIDTLHLNETGLSISRKKALEVFIKEMNKIKDVSIRKAKMINILNKENIAQISYLRFKYMNLSCN